MMGAALACRMSAPGRSSPMLTWLAGDPQNTATVDAASGAATVRYFDPFGADRDAAAPSWPNRDGFLNAPADPFTGTTRLGARDYSPTRRTSTTALIGTTIRGHSGTAHGNIWATND